MVYCFRYTLVYSHLAYLKVTRYENYLAFPYSTSSTFIYLVSVIFIFTALGIRLNCRAPVPELWWNIPLVRVQTVIQLIVLSRLWVQQTLATSDREGIETNR